MKQYKIRYRLDGKAYAIEPSDFNFLDLTAAYKHRKDELYKYYLGSLHNILSYIATQDEETGHKEERFLIDAISLVVRFHYLRNRSELTSKKLTVELFNPFGYSLLGSYEVKAYQDTQIAFSIEKDDEYD